MFNFFTPPFTRESADEQYRKQKLAVPHEERERFESEYEIINSILLHCEKFNIKFNPTPKRRIKMKKRIVGKTFHVRPKNVFIFDERNINEGMNLLLKFLKKNV